jgi:hypothetical protein
MPKFICRNVEIDVPDPVILVRTFVSPNGPEYCAYCSGPIYINPQIDIFNVLFTGVLHYHHDCYQEMIYKRDAK